MTTTNVTTRVHELKTLSGYYESLLDGSKRFEVRFDDRGFAVGDVLRLREYRPDTPELRIGGTYTGREYFAAIGYILRDFVGLAPGYVVLGFDGPSALTARLAESRAEVERLTEVARFFDRWAQFTIEHGGTLPVFMEAKKGLQLARDKYAALTPKEADDCKSDEYRAAAEAAKGEAGTP